jgi:hypothetical protein
MNSIVVPITDSTAPSTITRITNSYNLLLIRALWFVLAAFEFTIVGVMVLAIWDPSTIPVPVFPMLEATGMSIRQFTIMNMFTGLIGTAVYFVPSCILMWRSGNERTAIFFAFLFLPFMAANFSYTGEFRYSTIFSISGILFVTAVDSWVYLFPTGRFLPEWTKYFYGLTILLTIVTTIFAIHH